MEITMYDTLLQLPLFQGLCKNEQGAPCTQLIFLLNGEIISQTTDNRHSYALFETFGSPFVIDPYSLFGMQTNYTATYKARTDINIVTIDKLSKYSE